MTSTPLTNIWLMVFWMIVLLCPEYVGSEELNAPERTSLRIASYNIYRPDDAFLARVAGWLKNKSDPEARSSAILDLLQRQKADIIALQEVTPVFLKTFADASWRNQYYLAHTLGDLSSRAHQNFLMAPDGIAILSKWPMQILTKAHYASGGHLGRRMLIIRVKVQDVDFYIANLHLESFPEAGNIRAKQLKKVLNKLRGLNNVIVLGDFNFSDGAIPETAELPTEYKDLWLSLKPNRVGMTYLGDDDPGRLDRILMKSKQWKGLSIDLIGENGYVFDGKSRQYSDHYGLVATIAKE